MTLRRIFLGCGFLLIFPLSVSAQREGLVSKIAEPAYYFSDDRRFWLGKTIRFMPCPNKYQKNPYFTWCYDPSDMGHTKPKPEHLRFQEAVLVEVWLGRLFIEKPDRSYWKMGFFWRARLKSTGETIYYWDDGEGDRFTFGFVEDYQEARRHIGQKFWNQSLHILYKQDDSGSIPLRNLEEVTLVDVKWGEYGNYPLKFFLQKKNGEIGYRIALNFSEFAKNWHSSDPRLNFPDWGPGDWYAIERRTLRTGMSPQMVMLAWGKPLKIQIQQEVPNKRTEVWTYEGVRETVYFVYFVDGKLKRVTWEEKKK